MNKILRVANANKAILSLVNEDTKRNLSTTASRNVKVDVCGASGGIGQPLSLLLKQEGKIYRAFGGQSLNFGMERTYYSTKKEEPAAVHAEAPKKEVQVVTYRPWYKSFFVRGYASQTYDESNSIDFLEESQSDYHVPVFLYNQVLDRAFAAENRATKAEDELVSLKSAYRPLYVIVKTRQKAENWESLFGLQYPYEYKRPDKKSMVGEVYNFHFHKWMWIYDNCTDTRWIDMKTDFENKGYAKKDVSGSIASLLSLMSNNLHFPAEIGTITTNEVCSCLEFSLGIDSLTVDCVRTLFDVARK